MPPLRPAEGRLPQVWAVPHLPARARAQRLRPRHDEEQVVAKIMSMTDPIADFLTRIRNGIQAAHETVDIPASGLKVELARILREQGYINAYEVEAPNADHPGEIVRITLKYTEDRRPAISGLRRVSRPGQRRYVPAGAIPKVQGGMGPTIVSTSRGVLTGHEARQQGIGGEVVAEVW